MKIDDNGMIRDMTADEEADFLARNPAEEKEETYKRRVVGLLREAYSADDELALLRQRDEKQAEFEQYNAFAEACKAQARKEVYGDE